MTLGELKKLLAQYPDDVEVIFPKYSDYAHIEAAEVALIKAVPPDDDCWVMRSDPHMTEENKAKEKTYLTLGY